jgi:phage FluMu protein Com
VPISFTCAACGKALKTKDEMAGRTVKCPGCRAPVRIPAPEASKEELDALLPEEPAPPEKPAAAPRPAGRRAGEPMRPRAAIRGASGGGTSDGHALLLGGIAGLAAAVVGALLWYLIAKGANAKIGWIAWGIGWACGFAVATLSGGRGGALLPVLGAATALLGWIIGEYMLYSWHFPELLVKLMQDGTSKRLDEEARQAVRAMARSVSFGSYLEKTCDWKDGLFVLLAVGTGWGVPQKMAR